MEEHLIIQENNKKFTELRQEIDKIVKTGLYSCFCGCACAFTDSEKTVRCAHCKGLI